MQNPLGFCIIYRGHPEIGKKNPGFMQKTCLMEEDWKGPSSPSPGHDQVVQSRVQPTGHSCVVSTISFQTGRTRGFVWRGMDLSSLDGADFHLGISPAANNCVWKGLSGLPLSKPFERPVPFDFAVWLFWNGIREEDKTELIRDTSSPVSPAVKICPSRLRTPRGVLGQTLFGDVLRVELLIWISSREGITEVHQEVCASLCLF